MIFISILALLIVAFGSGLPPWPFYNPSDTLINTLLVILLAYLSSKLFVIRSFRKAKETGSEQVSKNYNKYSKNFNIFTLFAFSTIILFFQWPLLIAEYVPGGRLSSINLILSFAPYFLIHILNWISIHPYTKKFFGLKWKQSEMIMTNIKWSLMPIMPAVILMFAENLIYGIYYVNNLFSNSFFLYQYSSETTLFFIKTTHYLTSFINYIIDFNALYPIAFSAISIFTLLLFAPLLLRIFFRAYRMPDSPFRRRLSSLVSEKKFKCRDFLIIPTGGGMPNAMVAGLFGPLRYIVTTDGLLNYLSPDECIAVFGHEIGHAVHKHLWGLLFTVIGFGCVFWMIGENLTENVSPENLTNLSLFLLGLILYLRFGLGYISRQFERQADLYGAFETSTPEKMSGSLAHIADITGMGRNSNGWLHYTINQRIEFLEKAVDNPKLVKFHNIKARVLLITIVIISSLLLTTCAIMMHREATYIKAYYQAQVLYNKDEKEQAMELYKKSLYSKDNKRNADTHNRIAVILQELGQDKNYDKIIMHLKMAVELEPDNKIYLSNLKKTLSVKNE